MQVGGVGEASQAVDEPAHAFIARKHHLERGAELHAPDLHARRLHARQRRHGILVLDRKMAAVETDADVVAKVCAGASAGSQPSDAASAGPAIRQQRRSKNSMNSSLVSIRQSGSGSMSR